MFPEGRAVEFLIAGVVALIVVGPKDLPVLLRRLGQFMAKVRSMAAEFRASFDEMARQSELDELRKEVEAMRQSQAADMAATVQSDLHATMGDIHATLSGASPPQSYSYEPAQTAEDMTPPPAVAKPRARKSTATKAGATKATPAKAARSGAAKPAPKAPAKPRTRKSPSADT